MKLKLKPQTNRTGKIVTAQRKLSTLLCNFLPVIWYNHCNSSKRKAYNKKRVKRVNLGMGFVLPIQMQKDLVKAQKLILKYNF